MTSGTFTTFGTLCVRPMRARTRALLYIARAHAHLNPAQTVPKVLEVPMVGGWG